MSKPKGQLAENLSRIDRTVVLAALGATVVALLLAVLLARSIGRPIAEARVGGAQGRKRRGPAARVRVRGAGEIAELAVAFDRKMLVDLEATRRRLAATSRVAAWREVARRIAHEVKNPLAPIRAAVETLRRLRAREDPEFFAYFDEATRTVLDEVHRLSNMVTEFTRFARLPAPHPARRSTWRTLSGQIVRLHAPAAKARLHFAVVGQPPHVRADRDQVVQALTNLVVNALDAVASMGESGDVRVSIDAPDPAYAAITVADNGPGIAPEIAARLFEPYATTKAEGTGLGLAIAQRIAIEHQGELSLLAPTAGKGATFRLVLAVAGPALPPDATD